MAESQQFKIVEASISADRFGGTDTKFYDVRTSVLEINLFESLDNAYLTGSIVILDDKSLFEKIRFRGTERIKLGIASADDNLTPILERTFIMTGIERAVKSNENGKSSVLSFTLLDEHMFLSMNRKVSRSFNGKIDVIITKLLARELKQNVDLSYLYNATGDRSDVIQENIKGIIPNLHPIDAVQWLTNRATTQTGSPFFAYASMHDTNIRLGNLDVMLQQKPFNTKLPYTYNPSNVSKAEAQTKLEKAFVVKALKVAKLQNTIKLIQAGSVSAGYCNTNLNTGQIFRQHYSFRDTLSKLVTDQIIPEDRQNVFDGDAKFNDILMDDYESKVFHTVTSTGTYGTYKSYHDEFDERRFKKKLERTAILNHLYKNMLNVLVDGTGFIISKATVGDLVSMKIVNDNAEIGVFSTEEDTLDKDKSGDFLIYDIRHTFSGTGHTVSMNICKLVSEA